MARSDERPRQPGAMSGWRIEEGDFGWCDIHQLPLRHRATHPDLPELAEGWSADPGISWCADELHRRVALGSVPVINLWLSITRSARAASRAIEDLGGVLGRIASDMTDAEAVEWLLDDIEGSDE